MTDGTFIRLPNNGAAYWGKKRKRGLTISKTSFNTQKNYLIENWTIENWELNVTMKHPNRNWPCTISVKSLLYSFLWRKKYTITNIWQNQGKTFPLTKRVLDDLCAINDVAEFGRSICDIHLKELELKVEHKGDEATYLNLDITIKEGGPMYKLFDRRASLPFSIVR